jgi:tubulin alpha
LKEIKRLDNIMKEIIFVNLGQAGVNIGESILQQFSHEQGLNPDGSLTDPLNPSVLFRENENQTWTSRAIFADLDGEHINHFRKSRTSNLVDGKNLVSWKEDTANIQIRGNYTLGRSIIDNIKERMRKEAEDSDSLQGFVICHSIGGGTGSGLNPMVLDELKYNYPKSSKINFTVIHSGQLSHVIVEPYNAILGLEGIINNSDACFVLDNLSLFDTCSTKLDIERPSYSNLNHLIAYSISSVLGPSINCGTLNESLSSLVSNSVPIPRLKFLTTSLSPLQSIESSFKFSPSSSEITSQVFNTNNYSCQLGSGEYLACNLIYKGDVVPKEMQMATASLNNEKRLEFAEWVDNYVKVGYDETPVKHNPLFEIGKTSRSLCMISNHNGIVPKFDQLIHEFDMMYKRRPFVHWFVGEGLSEGFFESAREELDAYLRGMSNN